MIMEKFYGKELQSWTKEPLKKGEGVRYYEPSENGSEANFKRFLEELRKKYGDN